MRFDRPEVRFSAALVILGVFLVVVSLVYLRTTNTPLMPILPIDLQARITRARPAEHVPSPFRYTFNVPGTLNETGSMNLSSSPYFWLNSGGRMYIENGIGMTVQGPLQPGIIWQILYAKNNSLDTAGGYYPQNLFRLITRSTWSNVGEEVRFNITNINMTDTPNRDGWSGVFLMSRYQDSDNLYYAGIRMDGAAVIKKKYKGVYYTLAQEPLPYATSTYNRTTNPNLIPEDRWMRLRSETVTSADMQSVRIQMYLDTNDDGIFEHSLAATDRVGSHGSDVVRGPAHIGIRTDYLDALFDDYTFATLSSTTTAQGT